MKKNILIAMIVTSICSCRSLDAKTIKGNINLNVPALIDNDPSTYYTAKPGINQFYFDQKFSAPILSYKIFSSGEDPKYDPTSWQLKGSKDGKRWIVVDERKNQKFCSRFQEILCRVENPSAYKFYMLATTNKTVLKIGDVQFFTDDLLRGWTDFRYPKVDFEIKSPDTEGAKIYNTLVQDPDEYVKYHTQKVAEILFFSADDSMNNVQQIDYTLKDYDGISAKGGNPPEVSIEYSTRWVEHSAKQSLYKLDHETRGVLYHELTHAYQNEPHGIGNYGNNRVFWAMIEGEADAVRAQAGLFDIPKQRKVGGNWMDGYQTTGFFIQWLTTKDPNAIRKFNKSARVLPVWSFDAAMKYIFGAQESVQSLWDEYQTYLKTIKINK